MQKSRQFGLASERDLEDFDIDDENDLMCPFCGTRPLRAAVAHQERGRRQRHIEYGVYESSDRRDCRGSLCHLS